MNRPLTIYGNSDRSMQMPLDDRRGSWAMGLIIATEASLFVALFCSYFFLENNKNRWATNEPPKLHYVWWMLAVLVVSSIILIWGELQIKKENYAAGRIALGVTILFGFGFLALQSFEYLEHWKTLTPYSDSYGSIFYAITGFHDLHVIVGLLILIYVLVLPRYSPAQQSPYRPYHVAAMYWYFMTIVLIFIVGIIYVAPNVQVYGF